MSLERFTELWCSEAYPPESVTEVDLCTVERRLGFRLPEDYRVAVVRVGLPRPTIRLLDAIVERDLDLNDLNDFYSPAEITEETTDWRDIGMPRNLVAFASDCSGNKFCFSTDQSGAVGKDASAIWFWNHDFDTVEQISPSFDDWIETFCNVDPWPNSATDN